MRPLRAATLGALAGALLATTTADASFTAATLVSGSPTLQADYAYDPAISADGRWVAFTGSVASVTGVYRKDLQTGTLELAAPGDASAASISADGRYLSFTTSDDPVTGAPTASGCSAVYVRDMSLPTGAPGAFTLASARDASEQSLTYGGSSATNGTCPGGGAAAAARVALSADGRKVAFTLIGSSDLTGSPGAVTTPVDQIAVRDLDARQTTLVSSTLASQGTGAAEPVAGGAAIAGSEQRNGVGTGVEKDGQGDPISASTAAISADGTTVAWMGVNIPAQTPVASPPSAAGEAEKYGYVEPQKVDRYVEPLWRRIAAGPTAPTRRVTGGDDPSAPDGLGPLDLHWDSILVESLDPGPAYGTYIAFKGFDNGSRFEDASTDGPTFDSITPQLSADGQTVALLSSAPAFGAEPTYGLGARTPTAPPSANAFVVDMASGLTRTQALTPLTLWGATDFGGADLANTAPINDIALSPDGTRVAFTTTRTIFPLAPPELITPAVSSTSFAQLYEADLRSGTLALVSEGYDEGPANGDVYGPAFSGGGDTLVFASSAHNLVYGAINPGGSDVFAVSTPAAPAPVQPELAPLPTSPQATPEWRISATVSHGPKGSLLLAVSVPGAGSLSASASARVSVASTAKARGHSRSRPRARASRTQGRRAAGARREAHTSLVMRTVASTRASARGAGAVQLRVLPSQRYRASVRARYGLYATITVTFAAPGHPRLRETLQGTFHDVPHTHTRKPK